MYSLNPAIFFFTKMRETSESYQPNRRSKMWRNMRLFLERFIGDAKNFSPTSCKVKYMRKE